MEQLNYTATITVTAQQLRLQIKALEFLVSIGLGRMEDLTELLQQYHKHASLGTNRFNDNVLTQRIAEIKQMLGLDGWSNFGIGNEKNHQDVRNAYDLLKSFQKLVSTAENFEHPGTWGDGVIVKYGDQPVPTGTFTRDNKTTPVQLKHKF